MQTFHSHGKLLLTGEYVVLDGALALAIPTQYGQSLTVEATEEKGIHWRSINEKGAVWFEANCDLNSSIVAKDDKILSQLLLILKEAQLLNPSFLADRNGWKVTATLDFPRDWGLGTSSTLINNIAQWAQVDAFRLLQQSFGGSGYDVAVAQEDGPILFRLKNGQPTVEKISLPWNFTEALFFVHLNQKQDSREGIHHYKTKEVSAETVSEVSTLTQALVESKNLSAFEHLMDTHETLLSNILQLPTVKQQFFKDYSYAVKSLGAWGGDFVLAVGDEKSKAYFRKKGYTTLIPFEEMVLK